MSRSPYNVVVVTVCGLMIGCVPFPKTSVVHFGVEGRLVDASSSRPLGKTAISVFVDNRQFSKKTNRNGEFKFAPEMHHFWTWLGGPMLMDATRAKVQISAAGYSAYERTFIVRRESLDAAIPDGHRLSGNYVLLGNVAMNEREPASGANGRQPFNSETNRMSAAAASRRSP